VVYGPGEEPDARRLAETAGDSARLSPPTTLPTLAALLAGARMFVGGDSGPLHLACAVGCPVLGIYGPTDPQVNRPWGVPHEVVAPAGRDYTGIKRVDRESGGFEGLDPARVEEAAERLLRSGERAVP
jgi:ADP-heptose:LPS heptosyltransferase